MTRTLWLSRFTGMAVAFFAGASNFALGQLLYVGNLNDATVSSYVYDQDSGYLTEILPRVPSSGSPSSVTIHPNGKFLYTTNFISPVRGITFPSVASFRIDPATGALTQIGGPISTGGSPQAGVIDPSGRFLLVACQNTNNVFVYAINPETGALTTVAGSPFATMTGPSSIAMHPNGKFVFVGASGPGQIVVFSLGANGVLTPVTGSPFAARNNLLWMAMDPAGKFLFVAERQDPGVLVYAVDGGTGALTPVAGSPFSTNGGGVSGVAVHPSGKFLYASNAGTSSAIVYSIGANGVLTPVPGGMLQVPGSPFAVIMDPAGKFLYMPVQNFNSISAASIDPDSGKLTLVPGQPFPAGFLPQRGAAVMLSPPVLPPMGVDSVSNLYSRTPAGLPNSGLAQGSLFAVTGTSLGPGEAAAPPDTGADYPLPTERGGTSVQILSGDTVIPAYLYTASNKLVTGLIPSGTPLGDAMLTVTYNGRTSDPVPIQVVATALGIRTKNSLGSGPARALIVNSDDDIQINALNLTAKPGQTIGLQSTGLGAAPFDESTTTQTVGVDVPVEVFVGNKPVKLISKGRDARLGPGGDLIQFQLPDGVAEGCYVPVAVRAAGILSNFTTISISSKGGSCSDATGLSAADIDGAQKAGGLRIARIDINSLDLGIFGQDRRVDGAFTNYDFPTLLTATSPGDGNSDVTAAFPIPPLGSCVSSRARPTNPDNPFDLQNDAVEGQFLNLGPINVRGPSGSLQLQPPGYGAQFSADATIAGDYTADNGPGTQGFGPFRAVLTVPAPVKWTNQLNFIAPSRAEDATVTWSGGNASKEFVFIVGLAAGDQTTKGFLCAESVSAGKFTVPSWVLSTLPASGQFSQGGQAFPGGLLGVGTSPFTDTGRFTAPGFGVGVFSYQQATITPVQYR